MRLIICGDQKWTDRKLIEEQITLLKPGTVIMHGNAKGADTIAGELANNRHLKVFPFPALWGLHGKSAEAKRNQRMLDEGEPTNIHAYHDNLKDSKGTKDMVEKALNVELPVTLFSHKNPEGKKLEKEKETKTGRQWERHFETKVIDADGWKDIPFKTRITKENFALRWLASICEQPPSPKLLKLIQAIKEEK